MELFAVITLVIILLTLTHLINFVWRNIIWDDDDNIEFLAVMATFIYIISTVIIIRYIIIWGQALIK